MSKNLTHPMTKDISAKEFKKKRELEVLASAIGQEQALSQTADDSDMAVDLGLSDPLPMQSDGVTQEVASASAQATGIDVPYLVAQAGAAGAGGVGAGVTGVGLGGAGAVAGASQLGLAGAAALGHGVSASTALLGAASVGMVSAANSNSDDSPPKFASPSVAEVDENVPAGRVVYRANAIDSSTPVTYRIKEGGDAGAFSIDSTTGEVTLTGSPNFEAKSSYSFTVIATDSAGKAVEQLVTLSVNNLDEVAPIFTSAATAAAIDENSGAGQVVYLATSDDSADISIGGVNYTLKPGTGDVSAFSIDSATGLVMLIGNPNFEVKTNYSFTVVATDAAGNVRERAVTLNVNNLDEVAPTFNSAATAVAIDENSGGSQVVYTASATDLGDISAGVTYGLKLGTGDASAFTIDSTSGAVTLMGNPNFEAKPSYSFTVVAIDAAGNTSERAVTLNVNNLDEVAPTFTSAATAAAIDENSGAGQLVYTATSVDTADISTGVVNYSLKTGAGDVSAFSIDSSTGAVTLVGDPDFEVKSSYSFTVVATDAAGNAREQVVALNVNDLSEVQTAGHVFITGGRSAHAYLDDGDGKFGDADTQIGFNNEGTFSWDQNWNWDGEWTVEFLGLPIDFFGVGGRMISVPVDLSGFDADDSIVVNFVPSNVMETGTVNFLTSRQLFAGTSSIMASDTRFGRTVSSVQFGGTLPNRFGQGRTHSGTSIISNSILVSTKRVFTNNFGSSFGYTKVLARATTGTNGRLRIGAVMGSAQFWGNSWPTYLVTGTAANWTSETNITADQITVIWPTLPDVV